MGQNRKNRKGNSRRVEISFHEELVSDMTIEKGIGYRQIIILLVLSVLIFIREVFFPTDILITQWISSAF